ncbi:MAG: TonB-dependent receptor [Mangrovibacterium sp.]
MKKKHEKGEGMPNPLLNFLRMMKLIVLLIFLGLVQVNASDLYAQKNLLSVNSENERIESILLDIENHSNYKFIYNKSEIDVEALKSIRMNDKPIVEVLDQLFDGENIKYTFYDKQVILTKAGSTGLIQQPARNISGTVKGTDGFPVPGATVVVKGTSNGTITDMDGNYTLGNVSPDAVLQFSFVGMKMQEIPVSGRQQINVVLEQETIGLEEVVAIGYGTVKKRDITGSVASVGGDKLAAVPVSNVAQALKGRLPGVNVVSQDGRPDAEISIRVRGGGSVSQSNEPLLIVDGFPVSSLSDIPAAQIESIDVLKDASSTAIYGARGANGVIIVTTKSGRTGKLTVSYDGYMQFNSPTKYLETMNAYDYVAYNWGYAAAIGDNYADAWERLWGIGRYEDTYNNSEGIDHYKNVAAKNFSKEAYDNSFSHSHNLNVSSGNDKTKYIFSLNHTDDDGMKVNSWYQRTSVSFKLDQKIRDKLDFSVDARFTNVDQVGDESTTNGRGSILSSSYWFRPIATDDVLGELDESVNTQLGMYTEILQDNYNPVARMKDYRPYSRNRSLRANTSLSWTPVKGLTARSELGLSTYWNREKTWSGAIYNDYYEDGVKTYGGNASIESSEGWHLRWVNTLSYEFQNLGEDHSLTLMAGQEVTDSGSERIEIWGNYFPASFDADRAFAMMDQHRETGEDGTVYYGYESNTGTPDRLESYFGRVNYSYKGRYLLTATFRADGSSKFAPTHRWGYFPAGAVAWRMSEEAFLSDVHWLDNLKLRLSYGTVGNDGIDASLWKMNWESDGLTRYSINEQQQSAYVPASETIANPDLKWETTTTRNLGFDYGFFNNRIYGTLDLYKNTTEDLLMLTSVPAYTGFSMTYENIGETSNKGIELAIGADLVRSRDFNLMASVNVNINRGEVEELAEGVDGLYSTQWGSSMTQPNTGDYILQEGKAVGQVRGYTYDGWYTEEDFNYADGVYTLKSGVADIGSGIIGTVYGTSSNKPGGQVAYPGVIKYKDISGPDGSPDGVVDENDVTIIGDMNPKHTGGFSISGNYKNIDFGLDFNWSYGNKIYNANYLAAFYGSKEDGLYRNRLDKLSTSYKIYDIQNGQLTRVHEPSDLKALNTNATTFLPYHENPVCSTLGIEDGSYLRLNTVTLGYSLSKRILSRLGLQKVRVYGSVYNAFTITGYDGLDPEVNTNTSQGNAEYPTVGLDWGSYPRARSYTLGVNIEF